MIWSFLQIQPAQVMGCILDSVSSDSHASIADSIITASNPQEDDIEGNFKPPKKQQKIQLSYTEAIKANEDDDIITLKALTTEPSSLPREGKILGYYTS